MTDKNAVQHPPEMNHVVEPQPSPAHEGEWNARRESIIAGIIEDYFANGYEDVHEAIDELDRILRERLSALSAAPASPVQDVGTSAPLSAKHFALLGSIAKHTPSGDGMYDARLREALEKASLRLHAISVAIRGLKFDGKSLTAEKIELWAAEADAAIRALPAGGQK